MDNIFETLKQIEEASGNAKVQLLIEHPELKPILKAAYDPFKKYYMTAPEECGGGGVNKLLMDNGELFSYYEMILDKLNSRELSGDEAINQVSYSILNLANKSASLFQKIINKDLRIGVSVKTINKVWPGFIPLLEDGESMETFLVSNIDWKRVVYPCLCAPKLDGVRGRFKGKMYSRQGKIILGLEHIEAECAIISDDLDGELMVDCTGNFDSASGLIRNHNSVPEATYHIFDMPDHKGPKIDRLQHINLNFAMNPNLQSVKIIPHYVANNKEELMEYYQKFLDQEYEGLVLYDPDAYYSNGRGKEMMRIVPIKSADCKVIGFEEGKKGKTIDSLGAIIVDYKGKPCNVGSGFAEKHLFDMSQKERSKIKDEDAYRNTIRWYIWNNQDEFLGKIAHCEFKEESKNGVMRQPRFKGWREDKTEPNWD